MKQTSKIVLPLRRSCAVSITAALLLLAGIAPAQTPQRPSREQRLQQREEARRLQHGSVQTSGTASLANAQAPRYREVKLEEPAVLRLEPVDDKPLHRGRPMQFRLLLEGAPKPINMFSARIDYTSGTLLFDKVARTREGYLINVSDAQQWEDSYESRNIAGVSLLGATEGELARFEFIVPEDAPDRVSIRLSDHPVIPEKLAHDDQSTTLDFQRTLDFRRTTAMPVITPGKDDPPRVFPKEPRRPVRPQPPTTGRRGPAGS